MVRRRFWLRRIEAAWKRRSIVWLQGVRRAGKTVLCQTVPRTEYLDCELPSVRRRLQDPEAFLEGVGGKRIVLDEIHRLPNPAEVLKIAADHHPGTKVIATGSSTLQASQRFRDTLAGRKEEVWLTPMMSDDLTDFGAPDLERRLRAGGLPPFFLEDRPDERAFQEWIDSYWAKDLQELFRLERRAGFQRLLELIFARSGGIFEATSYAGPCEISRTTVASYLAALEATLVVQIVRPFSARRSDEIVSAPKVFAFDTGFVACFRGWRDLRTEDLGVLWEHYVLNELLARRPSRAVHYWRDKQGHEVDFVLPLRGAPPIAIECKWTAAGADLGGLLAFRRRHPGERNYVVASDVARPYLLRREPRVEVIGLPVLARRLAR